MIKASQSIYYVLYRLFIALNLLQVVSVFPDEWFKSEGSSYATITLSLSQLATFLLFVGTRIRESEPSAASLASELLVRIGQDSMAKKLVQ